jgi:hypothetical protein
MDSRAAIFFLALSLACKPGDETDSGEPGADDGSSTIDSGPTEPWASAVEQVPDALGLSDFMYDLEEVYTVELTISDEAYNSLSSNPYEYVEATVSFNGTYIEKAGVRLMGRYGSYRSLSGKPSFKFSFNEFSPGQNLFGLEKMNLKNMITDYSQIHDVMGYAVHNASGVPAPRVGYAWVILNGSDYGLYANIEPYEDHFLQRKFDDPSGNLYDGDYFLFDTGGYSLVDFTPSQDDYFQLDIGEDVGLVDIMAITDAVSATGGSDDFYETLDELLNWEEFLRFWAVEQWLCAPDSYNYNKNNYRVYFDPEDGKAQLFPWDQDSIYYSAITLTSTSGVLSSYCQYDPDCMAHMYEEVDHVCTVADNMGLDVLYSKVTALIQPYVEADPRREVSTDTIASYQSLVSSWIASRSATVRATWGIE